MIKMDKTNLNGAFGLLDCLWQYILTIPPQHIRNKFRHEGKEYKFTWAPLDREYQDEVLTFKIYEVIPSDNSNDSLKDTGKYLRIGPTGGLYSAPLGLREIIHKAIEDNYNE